MGTHNSSASSMLLSEVGAYSMIMQLHGVAFRRMAMILPETTCHPMSLLVTVMLMMNPTLCSCVFAGPL